MLYLVRSAREDVVHIRICCCFQVGLPLFHKHQQFLPTSYLVLAHLYILLRVSSHRFYIMAILLYKYIRGKYRENNAAKAATADASHLMPEIPSGQEPKQHGAANRVDDQVHGTSIHSPEVHTNIVSVANSEENARIAAEASQRRKRRWKLILGLMLPNFLAAVDVTIVAPAIPIISSHFSMSTMYIFPN